MKRPYVYAAVAAASAAVFFITIALLTPPKTLKPRTYGAGKYESLRDIVRLPGGYAAAGMTTSYGLGYVDAYIVRTDERLKQVWFSAFGGKYDDRIFSVTAAGDGGVAAAGYASESEGGKNDVYLVVADKKGNLVYGRKYGLAGRDEAYGIARAANGGFVLAGLTTSYTKGKDTDGLLIITDPSGNSTLTKALGGTGNDEFSSVSVSPDGYIYACGSTASYGAGMTDVWLVKLDAAGNTLWSKTYGGINTDTGSMVKACGENGAIVVGSISSEDKERIVDIYAVRVDGDGGVLWANTFGGRGIDQGKSVALASDGGFVFGATSESYSYGSTDVYVFKTDAQGKKLWDCHFGGKEDEYCGNVIQAPDGGFVIAGWTASSGAGEYDGYMLKIDANGKLR